jgi:hypothetical protein
MMRLLILPLCLILSWPIQLTVAQEKSDKQTKKSDTSPVVPAPSSSLKPALAFGLQDGTPVKLRINRNLSSADAKVGDTVDFEVLEDVKANDVLIIPRSGIAWATVTEAQSKRRMGRGGKLNVNIDSVRLVSGEKAALRAVKDIQGGGHTGAMTGAIVATSIVFFPAAPLFLFMKGKDITIPKGTEITAYINGDTELSPAKFGVTSVDQSTMAGAVPAVTNDAAEMGSVIIKSSPEGADILIGEKFVGSTPSTLRLKPGDHSISVSKSGFTIWKRTISLSSGSNITLDAALEKVQ